MIDKLFALFFLLLALCICGFMAQLYIHNFPSSPITGTLNYIFNYTYTFIDDSLLFVFLIALFLDLVNSYMHPSIAMGIINIFGIFILGYLYLVFINITPIILGPFTPNTFLPITTAFFTSSYIAVIIFFFMIFSAILNFWGRNK